MAVQVRRERTQTSRDDGVGALGASRVEGQGKIVDPGEGGAQVHQKVLGEDVGKAEAVLLRGVRRRTVEVKLAAADLESGRCIGSKTRRSEGVDLVVVVTGEEQIVFVELMIHAHVEAVGELRPVGAGDVVVRQRTGSAGIRSGVQLQVSQSDWVNSEPLRTVSGVEQELRRPTIEAVDVVVLVLGKSCFAVGKTVHLAETLVVAEKEGPIFVDRSTDTAAKLVLAELRASCR